MDYHQQKFDDHSYVIFQGSKPFALLPANKVLNTLISHQGLSYGGLLLSHDAKLSHILTAFTLLLKRIELDGFLVFTIKLIPKIYHDIPSDEIDYLLFKTNALLVRRDVSSVIETERTTKYNSSNRKRGLKRAQKSKLQVRESKDFDSFWNTILIPNLKFRHNIKPIHTLAEITVLNKNFPDNIRQFNVYHRDIIVGGVTIFESKNVAHVQYISANEQRQKLGSLDIVFDYLINTIYKDKKYFDFGISNEDKGQYLNQGLLSWKESFGATSIAIDFYDINPKNYIKLDSTLI